MDILIASYELVLVGTKKCSVLYILSMHTTSRIFIAPFFTEIYVITYSFT